MPQFNFQKRPYRARCVQWTGKNADEIIGLLDNACVHEGQFIVVRHPGGMRTLRHGDWVVLGEDGAARYYSNEVFSAKYEAFSV